MSRSRAGAADAAGLSGRATFLHGDAERLPVPDHSFDVVICECALCTFPDKQAAAREFARVLRPGGRVGIADITATPDRLPAELTTLAAWIACVADARPATGPRGYTELLEGAGLRVTSIETHNQEVVRMIDQIDARLQLLRLTAPERLRGLAGDLAIDTGRAGAVLAAARAAVADGTLGYSLIIARKPATDDPAGGHR
ncbi:methyltransferase domain-containing protein [Kribbella qitaiheensis]|uniref:methyltransferase domain-containing protein n=1 Tax=Kribbella qitaiheensis TaxID=1544730 RepID=UPI0019D5F29A|nr:methyltransferase domain-containing protein [Kribbella qitaiheensis]